jgi:hypothetical protein
MSPAKINAGAQAVAGWLFPSQGDGTSTIDLARIPMRDTSDETLAWARGSSYVGSRLFYNAQAAREPSRAASGMNCRRIPVPFIACANNKLDMQRFPRSYFCTAWSIQRVAAGPGVMVTRSTSGTVG